MAAKYGYTSCENTSCGCVYGIDTVTSLCRGSIRAVCRKDATVWPIKLRFIITRQTAQRGWAILLSFVSVCHSEMSCENNDILVHMLRVWFKK